MRSPNQETPTSRYSVVAPVKHSLHECRNPEEFSLRFESSTGSGVREVVDRFIEPTAPRAVFLTGSLPLGMATNGSDVDFVVLIDGRDALLPSAGGSGINTDQCLTFSNESDPLRAGVFVAVMGGITVEVAAIVTASIDRIYKRLRRKGPELTDGEVMTLGRLRTGWLLHQSERYLERNGVRLSDPALDVYCCTRSFSFALIYRMKAGRALDLSDFPQALHLGRLGVEMAYLAYFASEGFPYLGSKWLAQIGHGRGAAERVSQHPLLREGVPLLFPTYPAESAAVGRYLQSVSDFVASMRRLIGRKTLFRIAFETCPQT